MMMLKRRTPAVSRVGLALALSTLAVAPAAWAAGQPAPAASQPAPPAKPAAGATSPPVSFVELPRECPTHPGVNTFEDIVRLRAGAADFVAQAHRADARDVAVVIDWKPVQ